MKNIINIKIDHLIKTKVGAAYLKRFFIIFLSLLLINSVIDISAGATNTNWSSPKDIASVNNLTNFDSVVDNGGNVHLTYIRNVGYNSYVYYMNTATNTVKTVTSVNSGVFFDQPHINLDPTGRVYLTYRKYTYDTWTSHIMSTFKSLYSDSWSTSKDIATIKNLTNYDSAVDKNGTVHITYVRNVGYNSYVYYKNTSANSVKTLISINSGAYFDQPHINLDPTGRVYLTYRKYTYDTWSSHIMSTFKSLYSDSWSTSKDIATINNLTNYDSAVDNSGNVHLTYVRNVGYNSYVYYKNTATNTVKTVTSINSGAYLDQTHINIDKVGWVHLTYRKYTYDTWSSHIMYATKIMVPLILVHGWRPEKDGKTVLVWDKLKAALDKENIPYYEFNYLPATGDPYSYANDLEKFVNNIKKSTGYTGKFDIVCHSMGALVSRFYMAKNNNYKNIRQWTGIAPVNQGSAFADLMDSKGAGYLVIKPILSLFYHDISSSGAVANMRTYDSQTVALNKMGTNHDGIMSGVTYRVILGNKVPITTGFKSAVAVILKWMAIYSKDEYKSYQSIIKLGYEPTRVKLTIDGKTVYRWTANGDGAVANAQSMLNKIAPYIITAVGHSDLTKNTKTINYVITHYQNYPN